MSSVLEVEGLCKSYGRLKALDEVTLEVPSGTVFGVLGPNGSGKTTLLGILLDVLRADQGRYRWFGQPPAAELRRRIGTLLETPNFYPYLTGAQNLEITAALRGCGRASIGEVLGQVGLKDHPQLPFGKYSLGMKQRLAIGASLLGDPEVLVLDEPTNGLDPAGISEVRELILRCQRRGRTVFLASHLLDEVEKVCSHVAILKKGRLLAAGPLDQVLRQDPQLEVAADEPDRLAELLKSQRPQLRVERRGARLLLLGTAEELEPASFNRWCFQQGIALSHLCLKQPTLESRFLELTDA